LLHFAYYVLFQKEKENNSPRACIIGGRADELVRREVGADFWTKDGMAGVRLSQKIMSGRS